MKSTVSQVWELATPKTITYLWGFGSLLGIIMLIQVVSGLLMALYYNSGPLAWASVVETTREVNLGWLLRLIHSNFASFVFMILFLHFIRGLVQASFFLTWPWLSGWIIMVLTMAAAFLGYVLPWGQMSFWGATVIINLLSVLPMGSILVVWLWGGFYVSSFTCSFFYAAHFIVPFVVLSLAGVHLILLHYSGSSAPSGTSSSPTLKIKFGHIFTYKDAVNVTLLWGAWMWALALPDWSADPVNFVVSDLSSSPLHIQPEWYFLHLYAVLRSIPNKMGGLAGFVLALFMLPVLAVMTLSPQKLNHAGGYSLMTWTFLSTNALLMWLGGQPVEQPYIMMGQMLTIVYFLYFLEVQFMDNALMLFFWSKARIANSKE